MKRIEFSRKFYFVRYRYDKYHYTDARDGTQMHYLAYMCKGRCRIVSEEGAIEAGPGEAFYIPMGLRYQSYWYGEDGISFHSCGFTLFPEAQTRNFRLQGLPEEFWGQVEAIPLTGEADSHALVALYGVLEALVPVMETEQTGEAERILEEATRFIRKDPYCRIPAAARHCCVSESALYSIFKKYAGQTPNEFKQAVLAEKAVRLLTTTNLPVQDISDRLRFSSASYFRKVLKKHTGKTPRQIRKEVVSL